MAAGVTVPAELHGVQPRPLEEYVRARVLQFAPAFAARISASAAPALVHAAALDALGALPAPEYGAAAAAAAAAGAPPVPPRALQLVFRHDCLALGCIDPQCALCEHNPHRRCAVNFAPKYLVNDALRAKCDAPIRAEVVDAATGAPVGAGALGPEGAAALELVVLDGNAYDGRCADAGGGEPPPAEVDACALLLNNRAAPLLAPGAGGAHAADARVLVPLAGGVAQLPELHVTDSSEALLSGRKPPFRLLARVVAAPGARAGAPPPPAVRPAVSEGFVVATRRTRTAGKVEIPNVDDHVSKLEHMGKETVKKLADVRGAARAAGLDVAPPDGCDRVARVGEFRRLALAAEADGHLRQRLQQLLKLSKEKWDEARDHAMRAVVADNRMRIWYADAAAMEVGLLFTCRLGSVDLERPVGLLTKKAQDGAQTTMEATLMAQQTPAQRGEVRALQPRAVGAWWAAGHPGWAIYPVDSEQFLATGALEAAPLPAAAAPAAPAAAAAGGGALPAAAPAAAAAAAAAAAGLGPALAQYMAGGGGGDALLRAMSPFVGGLGGGGGAGGPRAPAATPFAALGGGGEGSPPFGAGRPSVGLEGLPSLGAGALAAVLGGGDAGGRGFPAAALGGFPSLAAGSGDLEALLAAHAPGGGGGGGSRTPSLGGPLGKIESLDLDAARRARPPAPPPQPPQTRQRQQLQQAKLEPGAARAGSGLRSMASIEQALQGVGNGAAAAMDAAAREAAARQPLAGHKRK